MELHRSPDFRNEHWLRADTIACALAPLLVATITWLLLRAGLDGAFLFDDMPNLAALKHVSLTNWAEGDLAQYLSANRSGHTGRPVAMLSFLPTEAHWPFNAQPFLRTNLLLHIVIGLLILGLVRRLVLISLVMTDRRATLFALIVAALWLLHPLHASTVFYTVQRMAQLSALFILASIYAYILGRTRLASGNILTGWIGVGLAPVLALAGAYAKENAALVPLALLLVEYWFLDTPAYRVGWVRPLRLVMLWLPSALIAAYLASRIGSAGYLARDFTAIERVLTQARILVDYLRLLLLPQQTTGGLFHDTYPISTGLLRPWTTLPAIITCLILIAASIGWRRRCPLITWGMVFFFAMHLAESSTVPLELYYEHRNYLPSLGVMVALTGVGFGLYDYRGYLGVIALGAMLATVAVLGHLRAQNWGHPLRQAEIWTTTQADSPRAWQNLALRNHERGYPSGVAYALDRWQRLQPRAILPRLSILTYVCPQEPLSEERWSELRFLARNGDYTHGMQVALNRLVEQSISGACRGLRPDQVHALLRALLDNSDVRSEFTRQRLWHLDGQLLLAPGFVVDAMQAFRNSHQYLRDPPMRMVQARYLANRGHFDEALSLLAATEQGPEESIYGPLHVYWLVHQPGRIEALAREIRAQREATQEAGDAVDPPRSVQQRPSATTAAAASG